MRIRFTILLASLLPLMVSGQSLTSQIRINQLGYFPSANKVAIVRGTTGTTFTVVDATNQTVVFNGTLNAVKYWSYSDENVRMADFSNFTTPGTYYVVVSDLGKSYNFEINSDLYANLAKASTKAYYYQRASIDLPEQYAGIWHRAAGHPDDQVIVHASAATPQRPTNTIIATPKGWYDAGDYNKYVVNAGISTFTFLHLYETMPYYFTNIDLNIPESSNNIPDLLDEALYNIEWMMSMQDPNDGGVYFKTTNVTMDGWDMPADATTARYVVLKSTTSTLDFAAIMAMSARIFADFETELPGFSATCLAAARSAWNWAVANPNIAFDQDQMNANYSPHIQTGDYPDNTFTDEFKWAAAELYITTGESQFYNQIGIKQGQWNDIDIPNWQKTNTLALLSLITNSSKSSAADKALYESELLNLCNDLNAEYNRSAYNTTMGVYNWDFTWGSNAVAANQTMLLVDAHRIDSTRGYLDAAIANMDYLLGKNPLNKSYVSGFGTDYARNIHHRQSEADNIAEPVPGFLSGGPNPWAGDGLTYPSELPAKKYLDDERSWATNEITINWNAPLLYVAHTITSIMEGVTPPPPPANTAPVIQINYSATAESGQTVNIDASGTFDNDGDNLTFTWSSASGIVFSSTYASQTSFVAPVVSTATILSIDLSVSDGEAVSTRNILITVNPTPVTSNNPPVIVLDYMSSAQSGQTVTLNAAGSFDANGDALTYSWSTNNPSITLSSLNGASTSFVAPVVTAATIISVSIALSDGIATSNRTVSITISPAQSGGGNNAPVVSAQYDINAYSGYVTSIDASNSYDPDGDALSFNWSTEQDVFISSSTTPSISFLAPEVSEPTPYKFQIETNDGSISSLREIEITILPYKPELSEIQILSVNASGYEGNNYPENVIDNNKSTAWQIRGSEQWLVLKTAKPVEINHFKLSVKNGIENNAYFEVFASQDGIDWELVMGQEESCGLSEDYQVFELPSTKAETTFNYFKLVGQGTSNDNVNSYSELKLYANQNSSAGKVVKPEDIMEVYPNPAQVSFFVDLKEDSNVRIIGVTGQIVYQQQMGKGIQTIEVDFPAGNYLVQVLSKSQIVSQSLVIK